MDSAAYRKIYGESFEQDGRVIPLVYPEERTNGPYLCTDCGQTSSFILYGVVLPIEVHHRGDAIRFDMPDVAIQQSVDRLTGRYDFLSALDPQGTGAILDRVETSMRSEGLKVSFDADAGMLCSVCGGDTVRCREEQAYLCRMSNCPGCFLCGRDLSQDQEETLGHCISCVQSRYLNYAPQVDKTPILHNLDLDLHCNGCNIMEVRHAHGIVDDLLKRKAY